MDRKKVLLRAPLLTNSGYGVHSRQVFAWLYNREDVDLFVECLQWGRTSWMLNPEEENGLIAKIMNCSKPLNGNDKFDMSIQVQLPDEWDSSLGKVNIGVSALVETDRCSSEWVEKCNEMDQIVVPSTFTKNVLKRSGLLMKPVTVIQEWFAPNLLGKSTISKVQNDERYESLSGDFNILMIGTLTSSEKDADRKNLLNSVMWACEEFSKEDDVVILLKTSFGKGTYADKKMCRDFLKKLKDEMKQKDINARIKLLHGNMSSIEMSALYNHPSVKLYASATRGEGYGLPLVEAAATGVPIVVTNWSGHLEFLGIENFGKVSYKLVEIPEERVDGRIFKKGFKWAEPDEKSFKSELRNVYQDYNSAKNKSKKLMKHVRENFNNTAIKRKYDELFDGYFEK